MYGLPDDFDATVFVGRTLDEVSFTANTLTFSFDSDISITVEGKVRHEGQDEEAKWVDSQSVPVRESRLMQLLGNTITETGVEGHGTLVLHFANGHTLWCVEDSKQYECYQLHIGSDQIIV